MGRLKILKASAGSGKTFMLAYEYVKNVILEPLRYKNILAVTFTNKATEEMKTRILDELSVLTKGEGRGYFDKLTTEEGLDKTTIQRNATRALNNILHDYSNFSVMTIDGFFQKIVRSFIKELHLEYDYTIDFNVNYLLRLSIDNMLRKADNDEVLRKWIDSLIDETLSKSKSYNIQEGMLLLSKMVLSDEFDKSYFEQNRDNLIAFFDKLSAEKEDIEKRVKSLAVKFIETSDKEELYQDDFPGKSRGLYPYVKRLAEGGEISFYSNTVERALTSEWYDKKSRITEEQSSLLQNILIEICSEISKNRIKYNTIKTVMVSRHAFVFLADISRELSDICSTKNTMLLSNTNYLINKLIKNNDTPYLYEKIGNRYDIIMIDEFQDTSKSQWENFLPLLDNALSQSAAESDVVTLVGDVKQSIYRWRGGDWRILAEKITEKLNYTANEINLTTNYRSEGEIIRFNNNIIRRCADNVNYALNQHIVDMHTKGCISLNTANNQLDMIQSAYKDMEQKPSDGKTDGGYVEVIRYEENIEQQTIDIICNLQDRGYKASDIAILVRSKSHAKEMTSFIIDYKKNNPELSEKYCFDIISAEGLSLNRSNVVKFIISVYSLTLKENITVRALYNRYLGKQLKEELSEEEKDFMESLLHSPIIESFEHIVEHYSLGTNQKNMAYLQALHSAIIKFNKDETASISSFLEWWKSESENLTVNLPEGQNAIKISTIHKSKGLQYKIVIIPYCQWNLTPFSINNNIWAKPQHDDFILPGNSAQSLIVPYNNSLQDSYFSDSYLNEYLLTYIENFNIFYVAITRAVKELYLLVPAKPKRESVGSYIDMVIENLSEEKEYISSDIIKYKFGKQTYNSNDEEKEEKHSVYINNFKHSDYHDHIKLHLESDKYLLDTENDNIGINARGKGIMLHKLFENIESIDNLEERIEAMRASGVLSSNDAVQLKVITQKALNNPLINSWFDSSWIVKNENSIILPNKEGNNTFDTLRPDRVLLKEGKAIVVDYKFGAAKSFHKKQINRYKDLLQSMGYNDVKGYLWYITEEKIVEV